MERKGEKVLFLILAFAIVLFLVLSLVCVRAEDYPSGVDAEKIEETGVKLSEKWEYLGAEWKNILLGNSIIKNINSFLQGIDIIFVFLFATNYTLSISFFLIMFFWFFFFSRFYVIFKSFLFSSKPVSLGVSFALVVISAHLKLIQALANSLIWLLFGDKPWWVRVIIGVVIVLLIIVVAILIKNFGAQFAASKQKRKEEENRMKLEMGAKVAEKISEAARDKE
jgi:hypothetical protein